MFATIVNTLAIVGGSLLGTFLKQGLKDNYKKILTQAIGLTALFLGLSGAVSKLAGEDAHSILFIISLAIGGVIGEAINIEGKLNSFSEKLDSKFEGNSDISTGFMTANFLFCVGAMPIIGALEASTGNNQIFFAKSVMDGITSITLASTYGIGVIFSAITIFIYQGVLVLISGLLNTLLTPDMIREFSIVGSILVACIGLDVLEIKKLKVENFIPGLFIPIIYYLVIGLF